MSRTFQNRNIVLIGMPGVGKSTLGVLLAKATSRAFIDTDVSIQASEGRALQDIINTAGVAAFRAIEEGAVLALQCSNTVIATGGSVVYAPRAMAHLRSSGVTVHLSLPLSLLRVRLEDFHSRGIVRSPGQSLESLFAERQPLYARYADVTVDCSGKTHAQVVEQIVEAVGSE